MVTWFRGSRFALGLIVAQAIGFVGECHAGPFTDWLRGRTPYYSSWNQTAYYGPTAAAYAPSTFQGRTTTIPDRVAFQGGTVFPSRRAFQGSTTYPSAAPYRGAVAMPGPSACPPTAAPAPCGTPAPQPLIASFAPQVRYRTTWVPVPVTRYRPVMATDPTTGCPTTSMQPCNSYTWQLRRVPVVQYRPIWAGRRCFQPRVPAWGAPTMAPTMAPGGSSCTTTPTPGNTLPYYAPQPGVDIVPGPAGGAEGHPAPTPA
ncbi:MAG: hypothetical protein ACC628_08800, partial [Pirellulaceae bacterium]